MSYRNPKIMVYDHECRVALKQGIDTVARAVGRTMGPYGRLSVIDRLYGPPIITKDGVTVARDVALEDPIQDLGARLCMTVATQTDMSAADGTSTATVMASSIIDSGLKLVESGVSPTVLREGLDKACGYAIDYLKSIAREVKDDETIKKIASIAGNSEAIGDMILKAYQNLGLDAVISVEATKQSETSLYITPGMEIDRGWASPYLSGNRQEVVLNNPMVMVISSRLSSHEDIVPILEKSVRESRPVVIVCSDIDGNALVTLVLNVAQGRIPGGMAIRAPYFGEMQQAFMGDLAALLNCEVLPDHIRPRDMGKEHIGSCNSVTVRSHSSIFVQDEPSEALKKRIELLKEQHAEATSATDREKLAERIAKLTGKVGSIKVGGTSDQEIQEAKDRFLDAVGSTKTAVESGALPGGGVALLLAAKHLRDNYPDDMACSILSGAMSAPFEQILANAGYTPWEYEPAYKVVEAVVKGQLASYDLRTNTFYEDAFEGPVIDSCGVVTSALKNATALSAMVLNCGVVLSEIEDKSQNDQ